MWLCPVHVNTGNLQGVELRADGGSGSGHWVCTPPDAQGLKIRLCFLLAHHGGWDEISSG